MFSFVDIRLALLLSAAVLLVRGLGEEDVPPGGCTLDGKVYNDKSEWKPKLCRTCFCDGGYIACNESDLRGHTRLRLPKRRVLPPLPW
ncbi:unnamed protein product [Pleuronectes platessa]|uniref:VWFC domain-containing protein n=1 Tax=Pleuronectes platessa TaxID=8262 RepID=A0A9N7VZ47_PLEPL|nr:unnamed protein product [Pleuronectes platessa]